MDNDRIQAAIQAYRQIKCVCPRPEQAPGWPGVMAELVDAETYFAGLSELTADQALDYKRVLEALKR